jgi:pimeloyl-ACP methyl ester carboxylesterase
MLSICISLAALPLMGCERKGSGDDEIEWGKCGDFSLLENSAECTKLPVPLDYDNPKGEQIEIFVFRYLGSADQKKGQLWFLEGGPGGSGLVLAPRMKYFAERYPQFDVYALDHRGVGQSARVGCPGDNEFQFDLEKTAQCVNDIKATWGDRLAFFTTTNAARDVHQVVNRLRESDRDVFIYGISYGTYWLLRYLQLYPNSVNGIVLDSICSPGECFLDYYDGWNNEMGSQFMELCKQDPVCLQKMSTIAETPMQALELTFEKIDNGGICGEFKDKFDRITMRKTLAPLLQNWSKRVLIPPLIYRLNRCRKADQKAVANLFREPDIDVSDEMDFYVSPMLADLIALSELFAGTTVEQAEAFAAAAMFSEDESLFLVQLNQAGIWPTYDDPEFAQKFAETDIPMLMLTGTTDPQTPPWITQKTGDHFKGTHQHFVSVPNATHGVMVFSTIDRPWPEGKEPCGSQLIGQFINDPTGELDTSCIAEVYPLEFDGGSPNNQAISLQFFGTEDMWEGTPTDK